MRRTPVQLNLATKLYVTRASRSSDSSNGCRYAKSFLLSFRLKGCCKKSFKNSHKSPHIHFQYKTKKKIASIHNQEKIQMVAKSTGLQPPHKIIIIKKIDAWAQPPHQSSGRRPCHYKSFKRAPSSCFCVSHVSHVRHPAAEAATRILGFNVVWFVNRLLC